MSYDLSADSARPTKVRYLIVGVTFLAALLLYLHRFCISYTQRYLQEDLGISDEQLGWCFGAFFFAYALAQVPSGWLSDRFGARRMLAIYILSWSAFTACVGLATGFVMLLILRGAVGLSQAGAYPTAASLLARWVPFSARGKANSIVAFGGRFGGFIAPILTVYLVVAFVPVSVSSTLVEGDLLDPSQLVRQLWEAQEEVQEEAGGEAQDPERSSGGDSASRNETQLALADVRARVWTMLSPAGQTLVQQLAAPGFALADESVPAGAAARAALRKELNSLLAREDLYQAEAFRTIKVEREASTLAEQSALSSEEQRRLNRLLLEAIFPDSIRKLYGLGWRKVMFVYGSFGLAVVVLFVFVFRERPEQHPWCNEAEQQLIASGGLAESSGDMAKARPTKSPDAESRLPWGPMIRSRSLWLMCLNQFGGSFGWVFLMTWLPRYLLEVHGVPYVQRGWMAAIPLSVGWVGMLLGGWVTDRVTLRLGLRYRSAPIAAGRLIAGVAYLSCLFAPNAWAATAAFAAIAFSNDFCNPAQWAYKQDVGGRYVGAVLGWANMWGNFGAGLSPILLAVIIRHYGWNAMFLTGAAAFLVAGTAALGVDARIPIDDPSSKTK